MLQRESIKLCGLPNLVQPRRVSFHNAARRGAAGTKGRRLAVWNRLALAVR